MILVNILNTQSKVNLKYLFTFIEYFYFIIDV